MNLKIKTVTVVGANGTMGTNVSGIFASFGDATVYMISRDKEKSKKAALKAGKTVKADSIVSHLIPADYSMLEECVSKSDLVFESVAENLELKIDLHTKIGKALRKDAIAGTGSSGLSITRLAECYPEDVRGQFFGIHMFNPPYQLTLCELTASPYSDMALYGDLKDYLTNVLHRTVAESKDLPAFLGNRIGFYVMNEALQYAERYADNGGIDYVDALLGPFTGRTMPPITTADFVGLDVHKAIVDNIYENTNDYVHEKFVLPDYVQKLIDQKKLGRKSGEGLYKFIKNGSGDKRMMVYDIKQGIYRDEIKYTFPFALQMKQYLRDGDYDDAIRVLINNKSQEADICLRFLLRYIVYALYIAEHVGKPIIGDNCDIHPSAVIENGVRIGNNVEIGPNSVVRRGTVIDDNVYIGCCSVIGSEGFQGIKGYPRMIKHVGGTHLYHDAYVGDNTTVGNALFEGVTEVGPYSKLDNHVYFAHNCKCGENCFITACSLLMGSTTLDNNVWLAPNAVTLNGVHVHDDGFVGAISFANKEVFEGEVVAGIPARVLRKIT